MKSLCLIFRIHHPVPLRKYRFFDIGAEHGYYDDYTLEAAIKQLAHRCYLPAATLLLHQINRHDGAIKAAIYLSGTARELFDRYTPEVTALLSELAATQQVEFLGGTYSHSLASIADEEAFLTQASLHRESMYDLTRQTPEVFLHPELIYSDIIGAMIAGLGYKGVITEGARHILGWKSPGFLYCNPLQPKLKVLMRHYKLSDDLEYRFSDRTWSEFPLTADKFLSWLLNGGQPGESVNLCIDMETFGHYHHSSSGIFNFLDHLLFMTSRNPELTMATPSEIISRLQPVSMISVPNPLSQAGEERDISLWNGNDLQNEALNQLYNLTHMVKEIDDPLIRKEWNTLQDSEYFRFMSEKTTTPWLHHRKNPFNSPYEAFINYMNILNELTIRVKSRYSGPSPQETINLLRTQLAEKERELERYLESAITPKKKKHNP